MNAKKWIQTVFWMIMIIGVLPYIFTYLYLKASFENNTYDEIVNRQIKNRSIYGTALNQNTFSYKLSLIKKVKPEIVALGSSRVMQFRKETFNASFVNAGGAMNYLNEGYMFLEEMYKVHTPKYILLGLDFFWFNPNFSQPSAFPYHQNRGTVIDNKKILKVFKWLANGKIKIDTLRHLWDHAKITNRYTAYDNLGLSAIATSDGFREDGSYLYAKTIFGLEKSADESFSDIYSRVEKGNRRFQYGKDISPQRVAYFHKILHIIQKHHTAVILIIPPVANKVYEKMRHYEYSYIKKFRTFVSLQQAENYDYHELSVLTGDDCECIDGFHGGDIIYQRILRDIYYKHSSISKYLNIATIERNIQMFKGDTLTVLEGETFLKKEVDFLKLDCQK